MADFISPVVDILTRLCGYCSKWADSIRNLGDSLHSLRGASEQLNSRYLDVKMKVETAEQDPNPELKVLNEVRDWVGKVEALQNEVKDILQQGDGEIRAKCFGGRCPKNCGASYKLNKVITQKLNDVNVLISNWHFEVVAETFAGYRFEEIPVDKAVGVESTYEDLCSSFKNNGVGIIGLYGMGGVGKTTLLKKFNNDFLSATHYVVIWVVVSKDADVGKIQDDIRKKLHLQDDIWNNKTMDDRTLLLYNVLKKKKFVLLLDDVWERIDMLKLGVPSPNNHECKIIFTTRSKAVCGQMDAQRHIKVECLTWDNAFKLFKEKVGGTICENKHILPLAQKVADECQGLPLALCVVGRAMTNKTTPKEWKRTVEILKNYPSMVQGIVEDVYCLLKFSYDRLPDSSKLCLLYCALFPGRYNISKEDLILLWIGERFLAEFDYDIHEAYKHGEDIISSLKYACLLESGDEDENTVKMHDVIRDMALWIACDHEKKTRFLVRDCSVTSGLEVCNHTKWKEVEKLSMWGKGELFMNLSQKPHYSNLVTLFIRDTQIHAFPTEVFVLPITLRVLDLSSNGGISNLSPAIGDLVNLEYMDLSDTGITEMPEELKNLSKLRFLLLNGLEMCGFPKGVVCSLSSLKSFSMTRGNIKGTDENGIRKGNDFYENVLLDELEGLDHLQDIRICVWSTSSAERILKSSKLQRCMCELFVEKKLSLVLHDLFSSLGKMENLETLQVVGHPIPEAADIPRSSFWGHGNNIIILRRLTLWYCHNIIDLNWIMHAPNLEFLHLVQCDSLVQVISEDFGSADTEILKSNLFGSLAYLHLRSLRKLKSICKMALQFPCLKEIDVIGCPKLNKLPFTCESALINLRRLRGDPMLMDQLQWEDEAIKHFLSTRFEIDGSTAMGRRRDK